MTFDLLIKNGTIVDGTGKAAFVGHVGVKDGVITHVSAASDTPVGDAARTVDAQGRLVTPGFVDIHTHYDAQATWDPLLTPSNGHGCTTVVMGSCGVGFAPARPDKHEWLIGLMEGVEDIPGAALTEGIEWSWETFPQYLDALEKMPRAIDIGAQVPHGALRGYVMGERGANNQEATADDVDDMHNILEEALRAGALGFSTSRTLLHKTIDGIPVPGTFAGENEVFGIARAIGAAGHGVFQMATEHLEVPSELSWLERLVREIGCTATFNLSQTVAAPRLVDDIVTMLDGYHEEGLPLYAQTAGRAIGIMMNWQGTAHPFVGHNAYSKVGWLDWAERQGELAKAEVRQAIIDDEHQDLGEFANFISRTWENMYPMTDAEYEPAQSDSIASIAKRTGRPPAEVAYDALQHNNGTGMIYFPLFNYADNDLEVLRKLHAHPQTQMGLSDAGAHCGAICDGGMPTFMLTHWARDRSRGEKLELEYMVQRQTQRTARLFGLHDRGTLEVGMKADINVIDFDRLKLHPAKLVFDLPAGGRRLLQKASGYDFTFKNGVAIIENDEHTEALPGQLIRGPQSA